MSITKSFFDTYGGKEVYAYTLTNKGGASVTILTYGGIMSRLFVPDRDGKLADVICGFDTIADYVADRLSYTGAIIGRYGNRIGGGGFTVGDTFYAVPANEKGRGHLHGGNVGFNRRLWDAEPVEGEGEDSLALSLFSPDGEEGYPGDLYVKVTYTFDDANALTIRYEATSNKDTYLNMTSHTYYNLNGYDGSSVMEQELRIAADRYDVIDELFIPVGAPASVEGTIFDFRESRAIANPYDHNFVLCDEAGELRFAAEYHDPASGRTMTVYTDLPAIQLYTAVGMDGPTLFKGGVPQRPLHALCLETQFSPNTPNRPYMPQCFLAADGKYDSVTKFVFGTK